MVVLIAVEVVVQDAGVVMDEAQSGETAREETQRQRAGRLFAAALVGGGLIPVPFLLTARWHWLSELFTHFRVQYAVALGSAMVLTLALRRWRELAVLTALFTWTLTGIVPLYLGTPASGPRDVRVLMTNVLSANPHKQKVVALIREERPDVVVGVEINRAWNDALEQALTDYPYKFSYTREDNMGVAIYSKHPFAEKPAWHTYQPKAAPFARAVVRLKDGRKLVVYGAHPWPPIGASLARGRNAYMKLLAEHIGRERDPVVVVGDFNCTPWSPYMADFLHTTGLADTRVGFGVAQSWPAEPTTWIGGLVRIPIDLAFTSAGVQTVDRRIGPNVSSDHHPLILDLRLPAQERQP